MNPRIAILSGGRTGVVEPLTAAATSIGRHPTCKIRLDAEVDTEVSNRHAVIHRQEGAWTVRDLGSIHGTYLNGRRIDQEEPLNDGDELRLGAGGPLLQFLLSERAEVSDRSIDPIEAQPAKPAMSSEEVARILEEEQAGQLARDLAAAERRRRILRIALGVAAALGVVIAGLLFWRSRVEKRLATELHQLEMERADSMIAAAGSIVVSQPAMSASLDSARTAASRERTALAGAGIDPLTRKPILARLESVIEREQSIGAAAAFAAEAVAAPSAAAVGLVLAQYADGSTVLAEGFAVRRDGTGGVLLTTRRAVLNENGDAPTRIQVLMPGAAQPIPARVIATHPVEDVALLRVDQRGGVAVVQGLAWREPPVGSGRPVALLSHAQPIDVPANGDWRRVTVTTGTTTGTAARVSPDFITIDGWGATLSAGSPVIDEEGLVAGLITTAAPSAGGRLYDAVPVKFALELLDRLQ